VAPCQHFHSGSKRGEMNESDAGGMEVTIASLHLVAVVVVVVVVV
jgi:hypothetical protein